ncbi:glycine cleavage system protein GcvH [Pusillimonas caeni]|uniref:glycine cleavage system protein GcvH n=1 Tax=Pusillimonas caeni TaxID=1348472 RepID=UPI000E59EBF4|nr:glycine cleavage system protein GcvH [Pusillimonas caeni]TFL13434.1 glycine cleavage system protein GcvH [Pusillimonas caeni]
MDFPQDLRYTASHEWIRQDEDGSLVVGLTSHAQEALGDIIFLDLPEVGKSYQREEVCGVIESVKAASDIYAPVSGEILAVNSAAAEEPGQINEQPYQTWLFRMNPTSAGELDTLLSPEDYARAAEE